MPLPAAVFVPSSTGPGFRPLSRRRRACAAWLALVCSVAMLHGAPAITIDGTVFRLARADSDAPGQLRHYVPEGETLEHWSRLVTVRLDASIDDPLEFVERLAATFAADHPAADCAAHRNRQTGQCALDFVLKGEGFVEWNFVRATRRTGGGVEVVQYAMRFPFVHRSGEVNAALHRSRDRLMPLLADADYAERPDDPDRREVAAK